MEQITEYENNTDEKENFVQYESTGALQGIVLSTAIIAVMYFVSLFVN